MRMITCTSILTMLLAIVGCSKSDDGNSGGVSLQLNWVPEPQFGGFYAMKAHGIDKKHGLDVTVTPGGTGSPTIQMLQAGKVDFAIVSADEIVTARARGNDVVALFAAYQT